MEHSIDREKVLHDLDVLKRYLINYSPAFFEQAVNKQVFADSLTDAIAMLKEQEAEKASNEYKPYNSNGDAIDWATIHKKYTPKEIEDMVTLTEEQQKQIDELKHRIHAKEFYEMNYAIMSDMEPRKKFCD